MTKEELKDYPAVTLPGGNLMIVTPETKVRVTWGDASGLDNLNYTTHVAVSYFWIYSSKYGDYILSEDKQTIGPALYSKIKAAQSDLERVVNGHKFDKKMESILNE